MESNTGISPVRTPWDQTVNVCWTNEGQKIVTAPTKRESKREKERGRERKRESARVSEQED